MVEVWTVAGATVRLPLADTIAIETKTKISTSISLVDCLLASLSSSGYGRTTKRAPTFLAPTKDSTLYQLKETSQVCSLNGGSR